MCEDIGLSFTSFGIVWIVASSILGEIILLLAIGELGGVTSGGGSIDLLGWGIDFDRNFPSDGFEVEIFAP